MQKKSSKATSKPARFAEIDILRGAAVILMIVFHAAYNLNFFGLTEITTDRGIWLLMARFVQLTFIITTGLTLHISYQRRLSAGKVTALISRIKHAAKIFAWAMLITLVTWLLFRADAVIFGVLHFYAIALLLGLPFLRKGPRALYATLILGLAIIILSPLTSAITTDSNLLSPLGIYKANFQSLDYFPLIPWFGWFLLGISMGKIFYPGGERKSTKITVPRALKGKILKFLGRHSLIIYLVHQPIIALAILCYRYYIM